MTQLNKIPATPEQIARFGHIAAVIREALEAKRMTIREFNEAAGVLKTATQPYNFINCKAAPTSAWVSRLHKVLGIPAAQLKARPLQTAAEPRQAPVALPAPAGRVIPPKPSGDVLQFAVTASGEARVRLDVVLPVLEAMPLIRLLLDQGFIVRAEEEG